MEFIRPQMNVKLTHDGVPSIHYFLYRLEKRPRSLFYKKINIRSSLIGDKVRGPMAEALRFKQKVFRKLHANAIF